MRVLITSGGTKEYIDDVRVLTNISSGKLGAMIAEKFISSDECFQVHYIAPKDAIMPNLNDNLKKIMIYEYHPVTNVQSVYDIMEELVPQVDLVIHCMAVSDFGFKPCSTKLKSSDPEAFIESMRGRIYQTPKILKKIKVWNPDCKLISFKFEVGLEHDDLIYIAHKSMLDNDCDIVIANDKKEMVENKEHIAYALDIRGLEIKLIGKSKIAEYIVKS